jgi:hypothetical protein
MQPTLRIQRWPFAQISVMGLLSSIVRSRVFVLRLVVDRFPFAGPVKGVRYMLRVELATIELGGS